MAVRDERDPDLYLLNADITVVLEDFAAGFEESYAKGDIAAL